MIHTGFESYTDQELADQATALPSPLMQELAARLLKHDQRAVDMAAAVDKARELEAAAHQLTESLAEDTGIDFVRQLEARATALDDACEAFKDADPGE